MYLSCPIFVAFVIDLRINRWRKVAGLDQGPGHAGGHENQQQQLPFFKQIMDVLWRIRQRHFCWFCCNGWSQKDRCRSQDVHIENVWQDCKQASGKKSETNHKEWWLECKNCGGFIDLRSSQDAQIARDVSENPRCITSGVQNAQIVGGCISDASQDLNEIERHLKWSQVMAGSSPDYELK